MGLTARKWLLVTMVATIAPLAACTLQPDLFNPVFLTNIGLDAGVSTADPQKTVTTIVLRNFVSDGDVDGLLAVTFNLVWIRGNDVSARSTLYSVSIPPETGFNIVLDCPVQVIGLGEEIVFNDQLGRPEASGSPGEVVTSAGGAGTLEYNGQVIRRNIDFVCGQVLTFDAYPIQTDQGGVIIGTTIQNNIPAGTAF